MGCMNATTPSTFLCTAALAALALLAGCGQRSDDQTAGQKLDSAIERTGQAAREAKQEARQGLVSASEKAKEKAKQAADATREAAGEARSTAMGAAGEARDKAPATVDGLGNKAADARITSSVKAGLAAEKELSATRIDVDTQDGVVTLSGAVPTASAKARANEIARGVKDVKSVNNQLTLAAS
jgi:osmotically-inducible protein OsmY